jgi:type II secretory pathway pseudopilin PulG
MGSLFRLVNSWGGRQVGKPTARKTSGLSLIEVVFAVGVIAVGLLGLVSVLVSGTRAADFGINTSRATSRARDILEIIRAEGLAFEHDKYPGLPDEDSGLNDPPDARIPLDAVPPLRVGGTLADKYTEDGETAARFTRNIKTERITNDANDHRYPILKVTVTIYWMERGKERSVQIVGTTREGT